MIELLEVLAGRVSHVTARLEKLAGAARHVHARDTRIEIFAACGVGEGVWAARWQTGVCYAKALPADLLAFMPDCNGDAFSPTTRYRNYAINRDFIDLESQLVTRADGGAGRRYRRHAMRGSHVLLFAPLTTDERSFHILEPARYVRHKGAQPMAVTWKLEWRLSRDLYQAFATAVA